MSHNIDVPPITLGEAQEIVETKTAPRVTKESIEERILSVIYGAAPPWDGSLMIGTMCFITMANGFVVHGYSAPASPENFDANVGRRYAYENAFKQIWPLEAYLLREKLHREKTENPHAAE